MRLSIDTIFPFKGYHGCASKCRIRVFEPEEVAPLLPHQPEQRDQEFSEAKVAVRTQQQQHPYVVIATELEDNPGTSVTNAAERLATAIWHLLERPLNGMIWVEHYTDRAFIGGRPTFKERFDIVEFEADSWQGLKKPKWRSSTKEEVEALVGQALAAV